MPFAVPLETVVDGTVKKKHWYRVTKGKGGELILRALNPPKMMTEAATRLILKLAAGHDLEPREVVSIKLLHGLLLMTSWKAQFQGIGHKIFTKAIDEYLQVMVNGEKTADAGVQERALRDLGLL